MATVPSASCGNRRKLVPQLAILVLSDAKLVSPKRVLSNRLC